jgi:hypothetical protein
MKQFLSVMILILALCQCDNPADKGNKKDKITYEPGDRAGADTSMIDISGSKKISELLCQRWDNKEDYEDVKLESATLEIPFRGFYFFTDGSMIKNPRENMVAGSWTYDDATKTIAIKLQNGLSEQYKINAIRYNELAMSKIGETAKPVKYTADGFIHKELINDPFYAPNFQWRIKPKAPEDDAAIHKRVKDCLHFYYLYYEDNNKRNAPIISFYGLPGCFKWYAGGIHLKKEADLDKRWTNIFYNASDASKAYVLLDRMISKKYIWDKEETNWVKQNADVLKQMEHKIDSL